MRLYYRTEQPIPADLAQACRLVRCQSKAHRAAVEAVLKEFFIIEPDGWHQKRCDEELDDAARQAQRSRDNGTRGGRPRKPDDGPPEPGNNPPGGPGKTQQVSEPEPSGFPHARGSTSHKPLATSQEESPRQQQGSPDPLAALGLAACREAGIDEGRMAVDFVPVTRWLGQGFDPELDVLATIRAIAARPGYRPPRSLSYFADPIAETHRLRKAGVTPLTPGGRDAEFAKAFAKFG